MAIKISGITVIDDSRNLVSVGVATVGSGDSAITLDGTTGNLNVGTGVTINGSTGDINISGILTVGQLNVPIQVTSFDPAIGSTSVGVSSNIILTFNQTVGLGTTGFLDITTGINTAGGTLFKRFGVNDSEVSVRNAGIDLTVNPTSNFAFLTGYYVTMSDGFITVNGSNYAGINTVGTAQTYYFTTKQLDLGDPYEGGLLICQSGGIRWIAADSSSQVNRNWYSRGDANTVAQANTGCTGWFVPSCAQLKNPGATCNIYWGPASGFFWSNTQSPSAPVGWAAWTINVTNSGATERSVTHSSYRIRSFRCVAY